MFFFGSVSSFRALTRAETFAMQANHRKEKEERGFVLPAFRGAQIFIERETPGFEASTGKLHRNGKRPPPYSPSTQH